MTYATNSQLELAEALGYTAECDTHQGHSFTKGKRWIWATSFGWQTADLVDGYYTNHWPYKTLEEALNRPIEEQNQ